jgi:hypothetical protein
LIAPGVDDIQISTLEQMMMAAEAREQRVGIEIEERQINGDRTTSEQVQLVVSEV